MKKVLSYNGKKYSIKTANTFKFVSLGKRAPVIYAVDLSIQPMAKIAQHIYGEYEGKKNEKNVNKRKRERGGKEEKEI